MLLRHRAASVGAALHDRWWQFGLGWGITDGRQEAGKKSKEQTLWISPVIPKTFQAT